MSRASGRLPSRLLLPAALAVLVLVFLGYHAVDHPVAFFYRGASQGTRSIFEVVTRLGDSTLYLIGSALIAVLFWRPARPTVRKVRIATLAFLGLLYLLVECRVIGVAILGTVRSTVACTLGVAALIAWRVMRLEPGLRPAFQDRLTLHALFLFVATACSGLTVDLLKFLFGRMRPELLYTKGLYGFTPCRWGYAYNSMPSGHSSTIVTVTVCLSLFWPRWRIPLLLVAALVLWSRLVLTAHYPSDVLAGAALGALIPFLVARWLPAVAPE